MTFLRKRLILIAYISVVLVGLLLLITQYYFTSNILNITIIAIIVVFPIAIFFSSRIRTWLKVSITVAVSLFLVLALWNLPIALAFSDKTIRTIQTWDVGTKQVVLEKRLGWAGPPYLQYHLRDFRIFGLVVKNMAIGYGTSDSGGECIISLKAGTNSAQAIYEFDRCSVTLT